MGGGGEREEGGSVFLEEMAALCLFCIPLALRFQDDLLECPFKGSGVLASDSGVTI